MSEKNIKHPSVDYLFEAILSLKDKQSAQEFFSDICTVNEILSISQRLAVASMLREEETYNEISKQTGASTATISRVSRALNYGEGSFDKVIKDIGTFPDFIKKISDTSEE